AFAALKEGQILRPVSIPIAPGKAEELVIIERARQGDGFALAIAFAVPCQRSRPADAQLARHGEILPEQLALAIGMFKGPDKPGSMTHFLKFALRVSQNHRSGALNAVEI